MPFTIRFATAGDAATIHRFVVELAEFTREPKAVQATADDYAVHLASPQPPFECLIAEDGRGATAVPLGFAAFFHNFSTWTGRRGIFLDDLYVTPDARRRGVGRALLRELARVAVDRDCARFEWFVLDWNEPAIAFYRSLTAKSLDTWTMYRLAGEPLSRLASPE